MDWKKAKEDLTEFARELEVGEWDSTWGRIHLKYQLIRMANIAADLVEAVAKLEEKVYGGRDDNS